MTPDQDPRLSVPRPDLPPYLKEGFLAFTQGLTRYPRPEALDRDGLRALTPPQRNAYDEARKNWHANLGPYATSSLTDVSEELWEVVDSNRQSPDRVKPCVAVDGQPGTGKTTALHIFARELHRRRVDRDGPVTGSGAERFPVCVTTLNGAVTRLGFNEAVLNFYGWPYPKRATADHLKPLVHAAILTAGTEVIIVDDVHFLTPTSKDGRDVSNHMKHLSSVLGVTFVFGGVDIKSRNLLTEGRVGDGRAQTGRRWSVIPVTELARPAASGTADDWTRLLRAMERDIVLARGQKAMLSGASKELLWDRTGGNLHSLAALVRRACHRAVARDVEILTSELLRGIRLDDTAQTRYQNDGHAAPLPGTRLLEHRKTA